MNEWHSIYARLHSSEFANESKSAEEWQTLSNQLFEQGHTEESWIFQQKADYARKLAKLHKREAKKYENQVTN